MRIKVLTEAGRQYADVELPFERRAYTVSDIKGRTIHADGSIIPFEGKPFEKTIVKSKNVQYKAKVFTLPDVQVGSIIEYRYSLRYADNYLLTPHWQIQNELFQKRIDFKYRYYAKEWFDEKEVYHNGIKCIFLTPKGTEPQVKKGVVEYQTTNMPPFVEEPYIPPVNLVRYSIRFYYETDKKADEFWKAAGKGWNKEIDRFLDPAALQAELAKIVPPTDTPEQKVQKIYAYVGRFNNLSYGSEKSFQELAAIGLGPKYTVANVIAAKTGDRDDITRLFVGLVKLAGVPAYLMRVPGRDEEVFVPGLLDWRQLDTEIAIVRLDGKDVFLDPGTRYCPYGMLHWKATSAKGVRQSATGGVEMAETPRLNYSETQVKRMARFRLNLNGTMDGKLEVMYFGQEALSRRLQGARTDAEGRKKLLEDGVKLLLPDNAEVRLVGKPSWEDSTDMLKAEFVISATLASSAGRRLLVPMQVFHYNQPAVFPHSQRSYPLYFQFPFSTVDGIHVEIPYGLAPETLPAREEVSLGFAFYRSQYERDGSEIVAHRLMAIGDNYFGQDKYPALKGFFEKLKTSDDQQIVLKSTVGTEGS